MVRGPLLASVLLVALLAPLASGHGDEVHWDGERLPADQYLGHSRVWDVDVAPNGTANVTLAFPAPGGGVPLKEGWLMLFRADVAGGPVDAALTQGHVEVAAWTWQPGDTTVTTRTPSTEFLRLTLHNPGADNATVKVYYDQTCECTLKGLPMESGPLWFNAPTTEGTVTHYNFSIVAARYDPGVAEGSWGNGAMTVRVHLVEASPDGADLEIMETRQWTFDAATPKCFLDHPRFNVCVPYTFNASGSGDQALWFEVAHDHPGWGVQVSPRITTEAVQTTPGVTPVAVLGLLAVAVAARRARS